MSDIMTPNTHDDNCNETIIGMPLGYWEWHAYPKCVICHRVSELATDLPYGSRYDGEYLCAACIAKYIDPVIDQHGMGNGS